MAAEAGSEQRAAVPDSEEMARKLHELEELVAALRSEIESLCMLHAIGRDGCELSELPEKLGLSPALAEPVAAAVQPLITDGLVDVAGAQVELTVEGRSKLRRLCPRKTPSALRNNDLRHGPFCPSCSTTPAAGARADGAAEPDRA